MKRPLTSFTLPMLLFALACGPTEDEIGTSEAELASATTFEFQTRNIKVPQIASGAVTLAGGICHEIFTTRCDGTSKDDTLLVLLSGDNVVAFDDDSGANGCSRIRYRPTSTVDLHWEVWRKPSDRDPTRSHAAGRVDVRHKELESLCPMGVVYNLDGTFPPPTDPGGGGLDPGDLTGSVLLEGNAAVSGTAVRGFAMHSLMQIATTRPSAEFLGTVEPRMMLLTTPTGPVEDYDFGGGTQYCPTCSKVRAQPRFYEEPSARNAVVMVGTRGTTTGFVDLVLPGKRLAATMFTQGSPSGPHVYGPVALNGVGSFVVELSYATAHPVGEPRGPASEEMGFVRFPSTSADDEMITVYLERCRSAFCSDPVEVDSTTRYRGHFGGVDMVSPIFLESSYGTGVYRVRVALMHPDVYLVAPAKVWDRATTNHVTTIGSWNFFMDEDNLDCSQVKAPVANVWTAYRNDIDVMALQEVERQCHFNLLAQMSNVYSDKKWEFFYTRGDTYTTNCDDDYVGILANQRVWPDPSSTSLSGRGRGLEFGDALLSFDKDQLHCWSAGQNSLLCDSNSPQNGGDPHFAGHGLGCRMQPDSNWGNAYPHALTHRISDVEGNEIIVVSAHQLDIDDNDDPSDGAPFSHRKTYEEDLLTLVGGAYGPIGPDTRIIYVGDLNMLESAHEWEDMLRRLRSTFGYAIDTRLIEDERPLSTWAGKGNKCSYSTTGGQNDAVVLLGRGWARLDPAVSTVTEEWADEQGGSIEYRAGANCIPACSGSAADGCVNGGKRVLATDHKLLVTKVRTAF